MGLFRFVSWSLSGLISGIERRNTLEAQEIVRKHSGWPKTRLGGQKRGLEMGTGHPGQGTDRPGSGTDRPRMGTGHPGQGTDRPGRGTSHPVMGTGRLGMSPACPVKGTKFPARPVKGTKFPVRAAKLPACPVEAAKLPSCLSGLILFLTGYSLLTTDYFSGICSHA